MELQPGHSQIEARRDKKRLLENKRSKAKAQRPVEKYGDVAHELKKARVVGMQAQAKKITIATIQMKVQLLRENADVFKSVYGDDCYNKMLVGLINQMTTGLANNEMMTPVLTVYSLDNNLNKDDE
jgi:hypothetical protein